MIARNGIQINSSEFCDSDLMLPIAGWTEIFKALILRWWQTASILLPTNLHEHFWSHQELSWIKTDFIFYLFWNITDWIQLYKWTCNQSRAWDSQDLFLPCQQKIDRQKRENTRIPTELDFMSIHSSILLWRGPKSILCFQIYANVWMYVFKMNCCILYGKFNDDIFQNKNKCGLINLHHE